MLRTAKWLSLSFLVGFIGLTFVGAAYSPEVMQAKASLLEAQQPKPKGKPVPTAMDAARAVCFIAGKSGMDCEVDTFMSRINMTLKMSEKDAKKSCPDMVGAISGKTKLFNDRGWTLWIVHPNKKKFPKPLAVCGII